MHTCVYICVEERWSSIQIIGDDDDTNRRVTYIHRKLLSFSLSWTYVRTKRNYIHFAIVRDEGQRRIAAREREVEKRIMSGEYHWLQKKKARDRIVLSYLSISESIHAEQIQRQETNSSHLKNIPIDFILWIQTCSEFYVNVKSIQINLYCKKNIDEIRVQSHVSW